MLFRWCSANGQRPRKRLRRVCITRYPMRAMRCREPTRHCERATGARSGASGDSSRAYWRSDAQARGRIVRPLGCAFEEIIERLAGLGAEAVRLDAERLNAIQAEAAEIRTQLAPRREQPDRAEITQRQRPDRALCLIAAAVPILEMHLEAPAQRLAELRQIEADGVHVSIRRRQQSRAGHIAAQMLRNDRLAPGEAVLGRR